ncbi:hypothetical protein GWI33_004437 [Rhynchophorus ferrugineus]|uniref:Uncharacterized protein n=1 Tax=Rhynchophorus ferrugineus TaxID=354439 RepID=A0A834IXB1_RHYFE|nr:hypothetical protein GWI33_004437 [Rhynchophorus ferrugineus]
MTINGVHPSPRPPLPRGRPPNKQQKIRESEPEVVRFPFLVAHLTGDRSEISHSDGNGLFSGSALVPLCNGGPCRNTPERFAIPPGERRNFLTSPVTRSRSTPHG